MTKHHRELIAYARSLGVRAAHIEHGSRHPKLIGIYAGHSIAMSVASSPGDGCAIWNAQRCLDRTLRRASNE